MNTTPRTGLIIAIIIVIALAAFFGSGAMNSGTMTGGSINGGGMMGNGRIGGVSWIWIPIVLIIGLAAWAIFAKKE